MKKLVMAAIAMVTGATLLASIAQEEEPQQVTHGELAKIMTAFLLGPISSEDAQDHFKELIKNKIVPPNGWGHPNEPESMGSSTVVTKADLATVVGQALAQIHGWFIPTKDNPNPPEWPTTSADWVTLLKSKGFPILSVGQAADHLSRLPNPVQTGPHASTSDPLLTTRKADRPFSWQDGAEIEDVMSGPVTKGQVEEVMEVVVPAKAKPRRSSPVTPD